MFEFTRTRTYITGLLLLALTLVNLATDIFIPSLPKMTDYFGIEEETGKLAISLNLIGLSLSALFYGPFSDCWGRRKMLILGTVIFLLGVLLSAISPTIEVLLLSRIITGLGGGAACVIALAGVSDLYSEQEKPRVLALTGLILAIAPGIAPLIGGYLSFALGWRGVFWVLTGTSIAVLLLLVKTMPETTQQRKPLHLGTTLREYGALFVNWNYLAYLLIFSFACSILWVELSELPYVFQSTYGLLEQHYGYYTVAGVGFYALGVMLNRYLLKHYKINPIIKAGAFLVFMGFVLLILSSYLDPLSVMSIRLITVVSWIGLALIISNALSRALSYAGENTGMASALVGPVEMTIGAAMVSFLGEFYDASIRPFALYGMGMALLILFVFQAVRRRQHATAT